MARRVRARCARRRPRPPPSGRTSRRCPSAHAEIAELGGRPAGARRERAGRRAAGGAEGRIMAAAAADLETRTARPPSGRAPVAPLAAVAERRRPPRRSIPTRRADASGPRDAPRRGRRPAPGSLRIAAVVGDRRARRLEPPAPGPARRRAERTSRTSRRSSRSPASRVADGRAPAGRGRRPATGSPPMSPAGDVTLADPRPRADDAASEVYEAWVIGSDGVPVPLGGFAVGRTGPRLPGQPACRPRPGSCWR